MLDILKDDRRRTELIAALETIVAVQGRTADNAKPAETPDRPLTLPLAPNSLGANLLAGAAGLLDGIETQLSDSLTVAQALPGLMTWAWEMLQNPSERTWLISVIWRFVLAFASGWAVRRVILRLLRPARDALIARAPPSPAEEPDPGPDPGLDRAERGDTEAPAPLPARHPTWRRLPLALGCAALDWLGVLGFVVGAHLVLATPAGGSKLTQLVILSVLHAYAIWQAVTAISAAVTAPRTPRLRLLSISTDGAIILQRQMRWLFGLVILGHALARVAWLMGLPLAGLTLLNHMTLLFAHLGMAAVILHLRSSIATWLGAIAPPDGATMSWQAKLAPIWHWLALAAVFLLWALLAREPAGGPLRVVACLLGSAVIVAAARWTDRAAGDALARLSPAEGNEHALHDWLRMMERLAIAVVTGLAILALWGLAPLSWLIDSILGRQILSGATTIAITLGIAMLVWKYANLGINRHIARLAVGAQAARAMRLRTLLPMLRTALLIVNLIIVGMTVLSQLGLNIAPLLAGAGMVGIAIGFGSQRLVQDVITGLFLLVEDAIHVGDVVTLAGLTGVAETLSVRSIHLRAEDGSVHVIPFSAVTTVTNLTSDFSHAVIEARVAGTEDYTLIEDMLRQVFTEMRAEAPWDTEIVGDLDMMGLARIDGAAMVIKCRVKCTPFARWRVLNEFQRRLQQQFAQHDIVLPGATARPG